MSLSQWYFGQSAEISPQCKHSSLSQSTHRLLLWHSDILSIFITYRNCSPRCDCSWRISACDWSLWIGLCSVIWFSWCDSFCYQLKLINITNIKWLPSITHWFIHMLFINICFPIFMSVAHFNMYHTFSSLKSLYLPVVFIHSLDADNVFLFLKNFSKQVFMNSLQLRWRQSQSHR